ncbi:MAG: DUF2336 domain-containing protein [Gammaproteobacteria bacterium]|nr:DUF2336 domain-containing protein [Alphaproteobacteria bacterium]MBT4891321.1 DUF2336 domain-containing protein [Gammaproteobacteria bacterium]
MTKTMLSQEDVQLLLTDPSGQVRVETATKIATSYGEGKLTEAERKLAEEIFAVMVQDAEVRVRETLASHLKESLTVPHDVALSLAKDVESVSLPVLRSSEVLTDADLVTIIGNAGSAKQVAVAGRSVVSDQVSSALVESGSEEAVTTLVSNEGAVLSEVTLQKAVDTFGDKEPLQTAMVKRPGLPITVSERLVTLVSEHLRDELVTRQELSSSLATDLLLQTRERATINLSSGSSEDELVNLVHHMNENDRLTASIVLRALCMGDLAFFEAALAELSGVSLKNSRTLIHDPGQLGLKRLYDKAGLPSAQFTAVRAAIDATRETEYDGGENDRERYSRRIIERILTQYGDLGVEFEADDLEYLLNKMSDLPGEYSKDV